MAARTKSVTLNESWRERIQASMLVNRLNDHIFNKVNLLPTQLKAIEILLRKVAPDLAQIEANVNVRELPEARVYPNGLPTEEKENEQYIN